MQLTINGKQYEWQQEYITGAEIRKLGNIATEDEIFLSIKKPWQDEPNFITRNNIRYARHWNDWEIEEGRKEDKVIKEKYFKKKKK